MSTDFRESDCISIRGTRGWCLEATFDPARLTTDACRVLSCAGRCTFARDVREAVLEGWGPETLLIPGSAAVTLKLSKTYDEAYHLDPLIDAVFPSLLYVKQFAWVYQTISSPVTRARVWEIGRAWRDTRLVNTELPECSD